MAIHKLTPRFVETVRKDGLYSDGGNLYLQVRSSGGARSWIFRYAIHGKQLMMGLGSATTLDLGEARERARACRQQVLDGIDPRDVRKERQIAVQLEAHRNKTFKECAEEWYAAHASSWVPETAYAVQRMIRLYMLPSLGAVPVHQIEVKHVYDVLKPIHETMTPTAVNVRVYLRGILAWATALGYRKGDNPAAWSGPNGKTALSILLPDVKKIHKVKHHQALPFEEIGKFIADLRTHRTRQKSTICTECSLIAAYVLEFIILTAVRRKQAVFAKWKEINFETRVWTCPPERTKTGKKTGEPHIIFLNAGAIEILKAMQDFQKKDGTAGEHVFVHRRTILYDVRHQLHWTGKTLNLQAPSQFLRKTLKRPDLTVHGFRTAFKSWSIDDGHDDNASEMALDHEVGTAVRRLYGRDAKMIKRRRLLMDAWGEYCDRPEPLDAKIIPMRAAK